MKFTPRYTVSYHGEFYYPGEEFDIDPADAEEMREHGEVVDEPTPPTEKPAEKTEEPAVEKQRRGRPRRADNDKPGEDKTSDG